MYSVSTCMYSHAHTRTLPPSLSHFLSLTENFCVSRKAWEGRAAAAAASAAAPQKNSSRYTCCNIKKDFARHLVPLSHALGPSCSRGHGCRCCQCRRCCSRGRAFFQCLAHALQVIWVRLSLCLARILLRHPLPVGEKLLSRLPRLDLFFLELQLIKIKWNWESRSVLREWEREREREDRCWKRSAFFDYFACA